MEAEAARRAVELWSAPVVALLDMIERPAAALESGGLIVGFNQPFREMVRRKGLASAGRLDAVLDPESRERVKRVGSRGAGSRRRERLQVNFQDGASAPAEVEVTVTANGAPLTLLVIEATEGGQAAASLRHDIAGPVTAILGATELLLFRGEDLPAEAREKLGGILKNCERISEILHHGWAADHPANEPSP